MKSKTIIISTFLAVVFIGGAAILTGISGNKDTQSIVSNVSIVDGKQIITINAKGGYSPRVTMAKADMPTVLKVATNGTFDCSSALTIPTLGYSKNLPPSGETEIEIPSQKTGAVVRGICSMGI